MPRKVWSEEVSEKEYEELADVHNVGGGIHRIRIDPPLDDHSVQKIRAIKGVLESDDEYPYAVILNVSPGGILLEERCMNCYLNLIKRLEEVLEGERNIPSGGYFYSF